MLPTSDLLPTLHISSFLDLMVVATLTHMHQNSDVVPTLRRFSRPHHQIMGLLHVRQSFSRPMISSMHTSHTCSSLIWRQPWHTSSRILMWCPLYKDPATLQQVSAAALAHK